MTDNSAPGLEAREDEWLAVRCQLGERAAFDELVARWHEPLWRYVRRVTAEDEAAREVLQDVWVRVIRGIVRLREGSKLRPWLFGIARRALMDRLRERYAAPAAVPLQDVDLAADQDTSALEEDLFSMQQGLEELPVTEREVLTLFYLRELSLAEVAEVLGVPAGTVKSRLFRARQMLRREMDTKGRPV